MNALKSLQPPTTLPADIPRFEENSGQSFSSVEVEKEGKDIGFLGALVTRSEVADGYGGEKLPLTADSMLKNLNSEDISTCIGSPESINNPRGRDHGFGEGVQYHFTGVDCAPPCSNENNNLGRGREERTWNPGIIYHQPRRNWNIVFQHFELLDDRHAKRALQRKVWDPGLAHRDILKQHLEDKVVFQGAGDDMNRCSVL
ncbi:hypothetical protein Tco_0609130 [Tanacetum coccineum]